MDKLFSQTCLPSSPCVRCVLYADELDQNFPAADKPGPAQMMLNGLAQVQELLKSYAEAKASAGYCIVCCTNRICQSKEGSNITAK